MAATLLLDTITSSGSTITVPTGKTLAITDAGNLTIGGTAITSGALGTISKTAAYTILAADFTGKSALYVFVNAAAGTDTETVITLPAASAFGTCAIHVVSSTAHGSGNKVTIKNSSAVEQYTLYKKGDHCEFVSDATNIFRTGNEFTTISFLIASSGNEGYAGNTYHRCFLHSYLTHSNVGTSWHTTNDEFTAPFDGQVSASFTDNSYSGSSSANPVLYRDTGGGFVAFKGVVGGAAGSASTNSATWVFEVSATDKIRPYYYNNTTGAEGLFGNAAGTASMFSMHYIRRY